MKASTIGGTKLWSLRFPTLISEGKLKFGVLISEDFLNVKQCKMRNWLNFRVSVKCTVKEKL